MTDQEREAKRRAKEIAVDTLSGIDLKRYHLSSIDKRLAVYAKNIIDHPDDHNAYELLSLIRFFSHLDSYELRIDEVQRFIHFYEFLRFSGTHGRQRYKMTPVQVFQFTNIMGFFTSEGQRLCRNVLLFVPRKYSKTTSVASLAVYDMLFGDGNAQAYTAANSYDQAKICFDEIRNILRGLDPRLKRFKINREKVEWIDNPNRTSFIKCLSNNPDTLDGLNASTVIMDEYAQADNADLYTVLTTSMGIRTNPLTAIITTASDKPEGPFARTLDGYKAILRGETSNDRIFAHIFEPDADDREDDPHTWAKVQPHLGVTVRADWYQEQWKEAQLSADNMLAFRTKLLNVFSTGDDHKWISGEQIRNHYRTLDIDNFGYRADCEVAVDLSVDNDFSAVSYYIYLRDERKAHIHIEYYFPEELVEEHRNRELYRNWARDGWLKLCKGRIIDYAQICNDIISHGRYLHIYHVGYDPAKSQEFQNIMSNSYQGASKYLYPFKQTYYAFTSPIQSMQRMVEKDVLSFNPNPINAFCFDNCILDTDRNGLCKVLKRSKDLKIDGAITAIMSVGMAESEKR